MQKVQKHYFLTRSCWPLIWMFCSRKANKINKLDERALRIVYQDYILNFEELLGLEKNHCFSIHHQNIQTY